MKGSSGPEKAAGPKHRRLKLADDRTGKRFVFDVASMTYSWLGKGQTAPSSFKDKDFITSKKIVTFQKGPLGLVSDERGGGG